MYEEMGRNAESHVLVTEKNGVRSQDTEHTKTGHTIDNGGYHPENSDEG
jgi:hypothetical protein